MGPGLGSGSPLQMLPPVAEPGVREMHQRGQEMRMGVGSGEWRVEGEGTRASAQPRPSYLRPLAGSLDGSEPQPASGTKTGSRVGGQVLQDPRRSRLPALVSLCVSPRRPDLHKPHLTPGRLSVDWLRRGGVAGGVSGGDPVPGRPCCRSAPRPPVPTFPDSLGGGLYPHLHPALRLRAPARNLG